MMCYWCWKKGHKASDCGRRKAGHSKSPKPGSSTTPASNGGGGGGSLTVIMTRLMHPSVRPIVLPKMELRKLVV
jgi:hypothetical protein